MMKLFLSVYPPSIPINLRNCSRHRGEFFRPGTAVQSRAFQVSPLAQHWTVSRWPDARRRRRAYAAERFLHRPGERRRLEDRRLWTQLGAYLRRSTHRLGRLYRGCAVSSEHHLRRQRRRFAAS